MAADGEAPRSETDGAAAAGGRRDRARHARLSHALDELAGDEDRAHIAVSDIVDALAHRSIAGMLFVFTLPNVVPTPPGTSAVLGVPMVILSTQLMLGMRPWLPKFIARRSMARESFAQISARILPWLERVEGLMGPRLSALAKPPWEYAIGAICLILSIVVLLPIPFGNMLPAAAISMFALGILERNGLWVLAGLITTLVSAALLWGVAWGLIESGSYIISRWFS